MKDSLKPLERQYHGYEWRLYSRFEEKTEREFLGDNETEFRQQRRPKTTKKEYTEIHCWALDRVKNEPALLRFEFTPFIYVQLPSRIKIGNSTYDKKGNTWTQDEIESLVSSFNVKPREYYLTHLPKFYRYLGKRVFPFLVCAFDSENEKGKLTSKIGRGDLFRFESRSCRCNRECKCLCKCEEKCVCEKKKKGKCRCEKECYCPCRCEKKCVCKKVRDTECKLTYHEDHVSTITKMLTMVGYNEGVDESFFKESSTRIKMEKQIQDLRKAVENCDDLEAKDELQESLDNKIEKFEKEKAFYEINDRQLRSPGLGYAQWFSCKGRVPSNEESVLYNNPKYPKIPEFICDWRTIFPDYSLEAKVDISKPLMMGWDIETNSSRKGTFPDPTLPKDCAWIISAIFQRAFLPDTLERYVFVYGDSKLPEKYEGYTVYRYNTEYEMILAFMKYIIYKNPIICSGHNIFGYDIKYLNARLKGYFDKDWLPELTPLKNHKIEVKIVKWRSSAYGFVENHILDLPGKLWIDTMVLVKRDYKLPNYTLDNVARHFLKTITKNDMTAKEMFLRKKNLEHFRRKCELLLADEIGKEKVWSNDDLRKKRRKDKKIRLVYVNPKEREDYLTIREFLQKYHPNLEEEYNKILEDIAEVVAYGERDSHLIILLLDEMKIWPNLVQQSNVLSVNIIDVFTRGQQIKVLNQIYRSCVRSKKNPKMKEEGIVLDMQPVSDYPFIGGFVGKPIPGKKKKVAVLDFASLYPSIIMAYNISPDSFIPENLRKHFNIDDCHIITCDLTKIDTDQAPEEDYGEEIDDEEDVDEEGNPIRRKTYAKIVGNKGVNTLEVWFIKQPDPGNPNQEGRYKGRLPAVSENLVSERREVRDSIPRFKDVLTRVVLDRLQNALKVAANSGYGILGVRKGGVLSLLEGSIAVTSLGRKWILKVNDLIVGKVGEVHSSVIKEMKSKYPDIEEILEGIVIEYNDTDSVFFSIPCEDNVKVIDISLCIAKYINGKTSTGKRYFPDEMKLEVEKIFDTLINIGPKMYAGTLMYMKDIPADPKKNFPGAKKGDVMNNMSDWFTRGILTVRRDNCDLARKLYRLILKCGLENVPYQETIRLIYDFIEKVRLGDVEIEDLLETRKISVHYSPNSTYFMKTAKDYLFEKGYAIEGEVRVSYLLVEKADDAPKDSTGYKVRPLDFWLERQKEGIYEKPDYMYYLRNRLQKPCDKLFNIIYGDQIEELSPIQAYLRNGYKMPKVRKLGPQFEISMYEESEESEKSLEETQHFEFSLDYYTKLEKKNKKKNNSGKKSSAIDV